MAVSKLAARLGTRVDLGANQLPRGGLHCTLQQGLHIGTVLNLNLIQKLILDSGVDAKSARAGEKWEKTASGSCWTFWPSSPNPRLWLGWIQ